MAVEGARRVIETSSYETANQYLRFGWTLINQHVTEATTDSPTKMNYVLASVRSLEDTRELLSLRDVDEVNAHLQIGWRLIDKYVTAQEPGAGRNETIHFILAWQSEEPPAYPGNQAAQEQTDDYELGDILPDDFG